MLLRESPYLGVKNIYRLIHLFHLNGNAIYNLEHDCNNVSMILPYNEAFCNYYRPFQPNDTRSDCCLAHY